MNLEVATIAISEPREEIVLNKKKVLAFFAILGMVIVGLAIPANARGRLRGDMELTFNAGIGVPTNPTADVSWVGPVDFNGDVYDLVFFPEGQPTPIGDGGWFYFADDWGLFAPGTVSVGDDGVVADFDRGAAIVEGHDRGFLTPKGTGFAFGRIDAVNGGIDPYDRFDADAVGHRIYWKGAFGATPSEFNGLFSVFGLGGQH